MTERGDIYRVLRWILMSCRCCGRNLQESGNYVIHQGQLDSRFTENYAHFTQVT